MAKANVAKKHRKSTEAKAPKRDTEALKVRSRFDLSFTARDDEGRIINWRVPHDQKGNWHEGLKIGEHHFAEVEALAAFDEMAAYWAIKCVMNNPGWGTTGWGIEMGFSEALARAAMVGLRVLRKGGARFDAEALEQAEARHE